MTNVSVTSSTTESGQPLISIRGELDVAATAKLRDPALAALAGDKCDTLALDLAEVTFLDSSGLGVLIEIRNAAREAGAEVILLNVPLVAARVVELAGLAATLGVAPPRAAPG